MKYVIEIKPEYEDSFKGLMILGAKDSNLFVDTLAVENLEELNSDYINEHFGDLQDEIYNKGLEDGRKESRTISLCDTCLYEYDGTGYCKICRFGYGSQYKEKPKEDEIKVGDVVRCNKMSGIVTKVIEDGQKVYVLWQDGSSGAVCKNIFEKTGTRFDISKLKILEEMM